MKKSLLGKILVILMVVLFITGCGEVEPDPIAGSDWRTTGSYVFGTLEHDETMAVLVGLGENKLTIFYDKPTKEAYISVDYPYETTDLAVTADSLFIDDLNEDGYTDLRIVICDQQGEQNEVEFLWDNYTKTFNCVAADANAEGDFSFINFIGGWTNENENVTIVIDSVHNWAFIVDETPNTVGSVEVDYGSVVLYTSEGNYFCTLTYLDNTLVDEFENVYTYAGPTEVHVPGGLVEIAE